MTRYFNTAGPCDPDYDYMLPASARLPEARPLIDRRAYFVLHAPRQTGKTTTLRALARELTEEGRFAAVCFSCEVGEPFGDDVAKAERAVWEDLRAAATAQLPEALRPPPAGDAEPGALFRARLADWAATAGRPLVLFFDEIDALRGESLKSVLRQLRAGFAHRPRHFPWSVVLCGLRDVRDYKAASGGDPDRLGTASPFNIKLASLKLGDFDAADLRALYGQHTDATGQPFTEGALTRAWELTRGQPWLVNALARETLEGLGLGPTEPVTADHVERAKERLILARQTHLDSLVARLHEPRVRRVLAPLIAGDRPEGDAAYDDDASYLADLGLVVRRPQLAVANPIYREVIVRVLAVQPEDFVHVEPRSFVAPDGRLDMARLLDEFRAFWIEHGDILAAGLAYHEVAPQLVLMAFLQRVVNGGGYIDREYGVGRGRIDLLIRWPLRDVDADGRRATQREALELKVWRSGRPDPTAAGLAQLDGYLSGLSLDTGVLVVFDRRDEAAPVAERTRISATTTPTGRAVTLFRG
ncbi:MAG: ATP-binding protein [Deltaproteobacteria bacterium]|nr:MAG: ATP-binding protein [Deltaproteobacteria bacterium]